MISSPSTNTAKGFTAKQVIRLTGVSYQTLNLWAKTGLVEPSVAAAAGSGSERIYSFGDLVALRVARELREGGVSTKALSKIVAFLRAREGLRKPLAEARLALVGSDVVLVRGDRDVTSLLKKPGQACLAFVVDVPKAVRELREAVAILAA